MPELMSSEPLLMLIVTDFEVELTGPPRDGVAPAAMALHVCGDGATRVPEAVAAVQAQLSGDPAEAARQVRAALLVAASQASYIGAVASTLGAGQAKAAIASSKKISVADVSQLMLLTPFDCHMGYSYRSATGVQ